MRCCVLLIAIASCGGNRVPAQPSTAETPYLMLFERGRTWALPIELSDATKRGDTWAPAPTHRATLQCRVAEVKPVGDATVSRVACVAPHGGLLVVGTWVATPAGLYHPLLPIDDADELALLGDDDLLITATPKEREHAHALGHGADSIEAFPFAGSWCVRNTTATTEDLRSFTLCFDGKAVTGGAELVITGNELHRARFGAAPEDPEDPGVAHDD